MMNKMRLFKLLDNAYVNEMHMDVVNLNIGNDKYSRGNNVIFRPHKLSSYSGLKLRLLENLIRFFNIYGVFFIILKGLLSFFKRFPKKLICPKSTQFDFVSSKRAVERIFHATHHPSNVIAIRHFDGSRQYNQINDYLVKRDRIYVFLIFICYVFRALIYGRLKYGKSFFINTIDSYNAIEFCIYLKRIDLSNNVICLTNHYDRWVYLVSHFVKNAKKVIVQHGYLNTKLGLPFCIGKINTLYLIDKVFEAHFRLFYDAIDSIKLYQSSILYSDLKLLHDKTILLISSANLLEEEREILTMLCSKFSDVNIVYKLHPIYEYDFEQLPNEVTIVKDVSIYPKCDVAVCENSFLGYEYKSSGYKIFKFSDINKLDVS